MRRSWAAITILALALGACSDADTTPLVLYSGRSEELVQPLIDLFEEDTGIEVEVRYEGSTSLAATLLQEGDATEADVFYAQDPASLGAIKEILKTLEDSILDQVDARFSDVDGRWVGTSGRIRTFVYNTGAGIDLPESIDEVVTPDWDGRLGIAPTNGSFLTFVGAMILERGEEATLVWLTALADNSPQEFPGNSPIVDAVDSGSVDAGLVNHYYLLRLRAEGGGQDAENWFFPSGDVGTLVMAAGAGILDTTDKPDEAKRFVEFLLSETAQEYFATETYEYPLVNGVSPAEGLPPLDQINAPDIDLSRLAEVLDDATRLVTEAGLI